MTPAGTPRLVTLALRVLRVHVWSFASFLPLLFALSAAPAQTADTDKPLPDVNTLMQAVQRNQRAAEALDKNYLYRESIRFDTLDSHEGVKKTASSDREIFWIDGVQVRRQLSKDGKPLTPDEQKKENDHIDDVVKRAHERRDKADAEGKQTDSHGREELSFSRMLELGAFSNPRRILVDSRPTILIDYLGDPHAKTHSPVEGVFKELAGTLSVDEEDQTLQHLEGHFNHDFKVGGGLLFSVKQGTWFKATFRKINNEVWLPADIEADGHARYLLFFALNGHFTAHATEYRKFKATSTIVPTTPDPATPPQN